MSYRERREARAERLRGWSDKNHDKSRAAFDSARTIADGIPLGQPILVGHHSERRHRRDIARIDSGMRRGVEHEKLAESQTSRAANIEAALDRAIFMDDHDAIERLTAKIADLEAKRDRMKAENAAYRKGTEAHAAFLGISIEAAAGLREKIEADYSWCRQPHPGYRLQLVGGTINKERKRLAQLTAAKTSSGAAVVSQDATTATARAGLTITATQTTPRRAWKKPRPVWNVSGNLAYWRPKLEGIGGSAYGGLISFFEDPTDEIERLCQTAEDDRREECEMDAKDDADHPGIEAES